MTWVILLIAHSVYGLCMRTLFVILCLFTASWAQSPTPAQKQAIEAAARHLERFGDKSAATALRADFQSGKVRFGPTPDNSNAACDMSTGNITVNPNVVELVETPGQQFHNLSNLAASLKHEYRHSSQSGWTWTKSVAQSQTVGGHPCEREAWSEAFNSYADWVNQLQKRMRDTGLSAEQREKAAVECADLAHSFQTYRNDFVSQQNRFGALTLQWQGMPASLDEVSEAMGKYRSEALAMANSGIYSGTLAPTGVFPNELLPVKIHFSVQGQYVSGQFKGPTYVLRSDRGTGKNSYVSYTMEGTVFNGTLDSRHKLQASLKGFILRVRPEWTESVLIDIPVAGSLKGQFQPDGSWRGHWELRASPPNWHVENKSGTWSASK